MSQYAKAIAAAVTPLVVWAITKIADNAGIEFTPDVDKVSAVVVAVVSAIAVYLAPRNSEKPAE